VKETLTPQSHFSLSIEGQNSLTPQTWLDYTPVILGIALLLGIANWFAHARKHYQGPAISFEADDDGRRTSFIAVGQHAVDQLK
jgi:hypothetical protein